ncbi:putative MFS nicotinic acid transporter Tna1 [Hysterangium stoloniferum]|nr:putative MFS nicotinic acid transporter Tna1 [Hysterangium stoloniferum]
METTEKSSQRNVKQLEGCDEGSPHSQEAHVDLELKMSPAEEKRLLRRIDLWILPYATLIYLLSFLDRINIAQARLAGLEADLRLHGNQYDIALTIFFIVYIVFEVPSNLVLKKLKPPRWLCFLMFCCAISQMRVWLAMGLVKNAKGLYATRILLGMFESGLFPGLNFLFTTWYTRKELNSRLCIFFSGANLAGAFGGLLAFGIRHMKGVGGKSGWAWIFILEGLITFICAIPAPWLLQDFPQYSNLLTPAEKAKWLHRLNISQGVTNTPLPFTKKQVWKALRDWKTYAYSLMFLSISQPFFSISLFVPSIIAALGFTNAAANALSAAPYALGTIITLIVGRMSDRFSLRTPFIVIMMLLSVVGYTIFLCDVSQAVKYVAVFITVAGAYPSIPTAITFVHHPLFSYSFGPMYTRAVVIGLFFSFGNSAGILSSNVYPISDAPKYIRGHAIALGFSVRTLCFCLGIVLSAFLGFYCMRENARRDRIYGIPNPDGSDCSPLYADDPVRMKRWGLEGMSKQEIIELGDQHPAFRCDICHSILESTYSIYIVVGI